MLVAQIEQRQTIKSEARRAISRQRNEVWEDGFDPSFSACKIQTDLNRSRNREVKKEPVITRLGTCFRKGLHVPTLLEKFFAERSD